MSFHKKTISNWGNYPEVEAQVSHPAFEAALLRDFKDSDSLLARGNGRCYGDAALSDTVIDMTSYNKILAFDYLTGIMTCQAGTLLADVLELSVPQGFFLPVTPGTKFVSVGGAIAADVHGKNHHVDGCFSEHVLEFQLLGEEGNLLKCSRERNAELFWATVGGMGLTGIITQATFQLKPIETAYITQDCIKAKNLKEIMRLFEESKQWTYSVAWIDCLQKGSNQGRSIMMRGEHATIDELPGKHKGAPLNLRRKGKKTVPFFFPNFTLNKYTVKVFNFLYYFKQLKRTISNVVDYDTFFYPLDSILEWNRIYGKGGFIQYQMALPLASSEAGLGELLDAINRSGQGSFLAVLKLFGKNNPNAFNSFPIEGYTLALDFKVNSKLPDLVRELDSIVKKHQGRLYLAKDTMSCRDGFDYFRPFGSRKFDSCQQERLFGCSRS
ncbi:FAD-binding oxidoreductase [Pelagicoccus sp. SDUM812002]|uniref:FAD-binding oxidoreductase n=1 Tax=Pelagicoccus sp. SDUM812002 TaxID=3041266 RepID=UPI00280D8F9B|nr:FAD-binding oxidoreductase [Pelagicoccus sp. SDUM812002]MDQ8187867.1 FAD-binding oxidoreductase [Pelagicoccus sp. SDUM812002]